MWVLVGRVAVEVLIARRVLFLDVANQRRTPHCRAPKTARIHVDRFGFSQPHSHARNLRHSWRRATRELAVTKWIMTLAGQKKLSDKPQWHVYWYDHCR